jgi:hypothetical protein
VETEKDMKQLTTLYRLSLALLLAASVAACGTDSGSSGGSSSNGGDGFSLRLTDAVFADAARVDITFQEVHLRKASGGWIKIPTGELSATLVDVAALQGTNTADLVKNVDVPPGDYTELRLIVDDAAFSNTIELVSGGVYELKIPSGRTAGLKIKGNFNVSATQPTDIIVDLDLNQSIKVAGPNYIMKPVARLIDGKNFGHARGMVEASLLTLSSCSDSDADTYNAVYVFEGHDVTPDDINQTDDTDVDPISTSRISWDAKGSGYKYEAAFLPAGEYTIAFTCNADQDDLDADNDLKFFGTQNITIKVNDILFL